MSVFHNIYASKYAETQEYQSNQRKLNNFNLFDNYYTFVLSSFKWKNLPQEDLPPFMIEQFLNGAGRVGAFMKDGKGYIFPAYPSGNIKNNGEFTNYTIFTPAGETFNISYDDVVIGFNNLLKFPYYWKIATYAEKAENAYSAVDCALQKAMLPALLSAGDDRQLKELLDVKDKIVKGIYTPFAVSRDSSLTNDDIKVLSFYNNQEIDILSLWDVTVRYRNLFYTTFGGNTVEITKKERLTQAEGSGNDEIVRYTLLSDMYERRKEFVEKINSRFGWNVEVELNRDISTVANLNMDMDEKIEMAEMEYLKGVNLSGQQPNPEAESPDIENIDDNNVGGGEK